MLVERGRAVARRSDLERLMLETVDEAMHRHGSEIPEDPPGPTGYSAACSRCGGALPDGCVEPDCPDCRRHRRRATPRRLCGVSGCTGTARSNGRCRRHVHGDDWYV